MRVSGECWDKTQEMVMGSVSEAGSQQCRGHWPRQTPPNLPRGMKIRVLRIFY